MLDWDNTIWMVLVEKAVVHKHLTINIACSFCSSVFFVIPGKS